MHLLKIDISKVSYFSLKKTALSHGWVNLKPFSWDNKEEVLHFSVNSGRKVFSCSIKHDKLKKNLVMRTNEKIGREDKLLLERVLSRMLSLEQDIGGLKKICAKKNEKKYLSLIKSGWGRILKAPNPWEDAVKTICTTNASWGFTKKMCDNLCKYLGQNGSFPLPEAFLGLDERYLKHTIKLGYRGSYVLDLAEKIMSGELHLEEYERKNCNQQIAEKTIREIKGLGPYGANHLLVLLGWNSYLPIDREVMKFLGIKQKRKNEKCPWKTRHYKNWGDYRFIIYKLDRISKRLNWIGN